MKKKRTTSLEIRKVIAMNIPEGHAKIKVLNGGLGRKFRMQISDTNTSVMFFYDSIDDMVKDIKGINHAGYKIEVILVDISEEHKKEFKEKLK